MPRSEPDARRRRLTLAAAVAASAGLLAGLPRTASAQAYPTRPIRIVVPFEAGGTLDVAVRPLGAVLAKQMGQAVIVENRSGANGVIGTGMVARAAPDGYTLLAVTASFALNEIGRAHV